MKRLSDEAIGECYQKYQQSINPEQARMSDVRWFRFLAREAERNILEQVGEQLTDAKKQWASDMDLGKYLMAISKITVECQLELKKEAQDEGIDSRG